MATWQDLVRQSEEEKSKKNPTIVDPKNTSGLTWKDLVRASHAGDEVQNVDENYINSFVADSNNFFTTSQTDYGTVGWGNAKELAQQRYTDVNNLDRRYWAIGRWAEANRDKLTEDGYNQIIGILNNYKSGKGNVLKAYNDAVVHYSQWDSEEAYNTDKQNYEWSQKYQGKSAADLQNIALGLDDGAEKKWVTGYAAYVDDEEKAGFDLEAGQAEIDAMEAKLAELRRQRNAGYGTNNTHTGMTYGASQQGNEDIDKQIKDLEAQIAVKKAYLNQAKNIQTARAGDAVAGNEDFSQYSGYVSTISPSPTWDQPVAVDETYEWINNQNGYREQYEAEYDRTHRTKSGDTSTGYGAIRQTGYDVAVTESEYEKKGYDYLTEDEIAIYNYYYAKEGKEKAEQYLNSIQERLNQRKGEAIFKSMEGNTAKEIVFGIATGLDQFGTSLDSVFNFKDEYIPYSALQFTSGMIREDLADDGAQLPSWLGGGSLAQAAYDAVNTSANMAPSILAATVANAFVPGAGSWLGSALMGASAAGSAYQQALHDGYSKKEARIYSTMIGVTEMVMEKFLSGITEFGGNMVGKFLVRNMNAADDALKMIARQVLGGMASEFTEEYLQEVIEPVIQNLVFNTNHDVELISSDAFYAGFLGALTAFGPELTNSGVTAIKYTSTGKNLVASGVTAKDLADVGSKFAANTVAYKLAGQIDENTNAFTMGRMFHEIGAQLTEQNVSAIAEALEQEGMPKKIARKNAEILAYIVEGGKVSDFQMRMIEKNDVLAKVMREVIIDPNSTVYQRTAGYNNVLRKLAGETVEARTVGSSKANGDSEVSVVAQKENGSESRSEGGTGDRKASGIVSVKKGNPVVKLDDGSEVSLQDADLSPDDALIIKTVTDIDGISAEDAGDIFKILKAVDSDPAASSLGAMEAYRYGYYGFSEKHLADNANFAKKLTETQRKAIYDIGKKARQQSLEKSKPKQKSTKGEKTGVYFDQGGGKVVSFSEPEKSGLSPQQNAGVRAAMVLRKLGIGGDIYFFESYLNSNGKRVFKNENGEEVSAPNGWYDPKDGSIHIDLNAGNKGQGYVLFTLSHELTHFIEQWSEDKYEVLADFLVKNYEKGHTMDELVRRKQRRLTEIRGKEVSYSEAYSEVVADSMEAMLADGNVMDKLLELKAKDQSLFEKMKQFFDNLLNKIRAAYKGLQPDSEEGKAVLEMQESIEKIQQLFAEALADASENFQRAEKNTTEDGGAQYQIREIGNTGKFYVQADRQVLTGGDSSLWGKQIENYINEQIRKEQDIAIPTSDGHVLLLTGRSSYKLSDQAAASIQNKIRVMLSDEEYALKGRAATHIDELIQVAKFDGYEEDLDGKHENDIGEDGFNYFEAYFRDFDGKYYRVPLSAAINESEETVYSIGKIRQRSFPAGRGSSSKKEALKKGRKASENIIYSSESKSQEVKTALQLAYERALNKKDKGVQFSDRDTESVSARDLLARTDVATVKNEVAKKKLAGYQKTLEVMTAEEQKLREIRADIKRLSFAKGTKDTKRLTDLKLEAANINKHLSVYEGQLQRMEKELQSVVKRERAKVVKKAEKRDKAVLAKEWMAAEVKQSETLRDLRETRAALRQQESDTAVMEKEFIRITKEYEKQDAKHGKTISNLREKLKNEAEKHRADNKMWMSEFGRLMREYDAAGRNIDRLEQKIERQKAVAKERVESRGRTAVRHKIQNVVDELNRLLLTDSKKHRVPDSLKKAVAEALDLVNMDTIGAEERAAKYEALIAKERAKANPDQDKIDAYTVSMENILRKGEKMGQKLNDLHAAYEKIQNSDDPDIANAYDPVIAGAISELAETIGNTSLKDMTIDQLNDVYDVYKMVLIRVRDANKALAENIAKSIEELAKSTIREVQAVGGAKKYRAAVMDPVRKFDFDNMKPVYAMERIGSDTLIEVFNNVRAGEDTWASDVSEARAYYLDKVKKYGYDKWDFDKKYRFESASGIAFDLTLEQIMSLYAYSRREQAIDHLRLGGFVFDSNIETVKEKGKLVKYKVNTADAHQITPEIMADIVGKLSKEQIGFVEDMQDYLSTVMGAKGNEVTSKMYGVKLFKEKFYFPLKSAKQFMFEQNEVAGEVKIKNSGFTNKVVAKANNPVVLSNFMDVWAGHVNDMSMYHAFTLPLEDFNRVFNYNTPKKDGVEPVSVKGTIQNAYSPAAVQYIKQLITDLNGGARTDSTTGFINKMMGLFKKGSVFASLSVVVQQPSAIARAAALIDAKYFIGPKLDQKRHNALWEEVKKYAPVALIKEMGYFDTNMGKSTLDYITGREYSGFTEKMKALVTDSNYRDEVLSKAPALADEMAWCSIWEAVKRETKANHPGMDVKSDAFLKLAGARFTEVITKTQVYDSVLARSANMRSKDTGMKMATAFMAEPTTSINMIEDALFKAKRGGAAGKRYCRRAIGAVIASQILNSILVSFVYAARDDDEDETYLEKYIGALTGGIMDGLNPATYIPFIKDIISIVQGYDVERSDMSVVSDLWKAWQNLGKDNVSTYRKVEGFVGSIAQIFGLPVKNIMRDARGIYNAIMTITGADKATGAGIKYAIEEARTGKSVPDKVQLYEARMAGDTEHAARVEARYDDAESADSAVRAAIKDSFMAGEIDESTALKHMVLYAGMDADEAYWLMDSWKYRKAVGSDDGYGKYSNLYDAVRTGTDLEGVIKTYTDNGIKPSTLTSQITEEFKPEYVKLTPKERSAMRGKLVDAFVLCGMERDDAEEKLDSWDFEAEHGFAYSDRKEAYENGEVSRSELVAILVGRGYSPEDANAQIDSYEWEAEGYEDVTYAAIRNYNAYCAPVGISKAVYVSFWEFEKDTENDVNEATGKPIAYSAVRKIMAYINSLNLTPAQKDALAKSAGWKDSTIKKYKLW